MIVSLKESVMNMWEIGVSIEVKNVWEERLD